MIMARKNDYYGSLSSSTTIDETDRLFDRVTTGNGGAASAADGGYGHHVHGEENDIEYDHHTNRTNGGAGGAAGAAASSAGPLIRRLSDGMQELQALKRNVSFKLSQKALDEMEDRIHNKAAVVQNPGGVTVPREIANMTKNLIGGGVLSLSGGMAMYADSPRASLSAVAYVAALGAIFGYFCLLIGKACDMSLSGTYRECWERTVGQRGGLAVAIVNSLDALLGIFANASILSQSLQLLLEGIGVYITVVECLLLVTILGLLPLCLMKNLGALAPFSAMGMAAVLVALGCMIIRYLDGSYLPGGEFYDDTPDNLSPSFGHENRPLSVNALPFICMVYTSFDMHYNSPSFYAELKDASVPRYGQVIGWSFGITAILYFSIAIVGFLTFGANCDSYILNNYSPRDSLATVSRLAIGLCALGSYPLNFIGVRDNCLDILGITDEVNTATKLNMFTISLLTILTIMECFITDLGLINSVGGGTTVTLVDFIFPALMFREGVKRRAASVGGDVGRWLQSEVWLVMVLMVVGVLLGIVGVWVSITLS